MIVQIEVATEAERLALSVLFGARVVTTSSGPHETASGFCALTLRRLRRDRNMTQMELSEESGVTNTTISALERGKVLFPRPSTMQRIADTLGVPVSRFFESGEEPE